MWKLFIFTALIAGTGTRAQKPEALQDCFENDSITCLQIQIFRKAREFFSQEKIDILGGISLTKNPNDRGAKSSENVLLDQQVEAANDVEDRENALESYMWGKAKSFLTERSITWNPSQTARGLVDAIPENIKQDFTSLMTEGRGKKKVLKMILPLLIGFKLKMIILAVLAYFGIALIAKKAILTSLVSLAVSGFIAVKKLLAKHDHHHEEVSGYHGGWSGGGGGAGWSHSDVGGGWGGHEGEFGGYGSHSSPVAQQIAYNGQKHK